MRTYLKKLEMLVTMYYWPMQRKKYLKEDDILLIFGDPELLNNIYFSTQDVILAIESYFVQYGTSKCIAEVFLERYIYLEPYGPFIDQENQLKAIEKIKQLKEQKKEFTLFLKKNISEFK